MENIVFTDHAKYQMNLRLIAKSTVISAITKPDLITTQDDFRYRAIKHLTKNDKQYILVIIYEKQSQIILIITTFITSKITKYLS